MNDEINEYSIGIYGHVNFKKIIKQAKNAGLRLTYSNYSNQNFKENSTEIEKIFDGFIYKNLGLLYVKANTRQLELLIGPSASNYKLLNASETYFTPLNDLKETPPLAKTLPMLDEASWGIEQTKVAKSKYTGKGIHIAILDTGIDTGHPYFHNTDISTNSFIEGQNAHDGNGHGSHCAGIIAGSPKNSSGLRSSIAPDVKIFSGKVLRDSGASHSRYVFQGIDWALEKKCKVISISLGSRIRKGMPYSPAFEKIAQSALAKGSLIVAAAGNDSYRHLQRLLPVSEPANCPSIMAIGAINEQRGMYNKSNAGINPYGGHIDLVAPGVAIESCYTASEKYKKLSGTSMATSYVAGIAVLYMEAFPNKTPQEIRALLNKNAVPLSFPKRDMGYGLVQAI